MAITMPRVEKFMTPMPVVVSEDLPLSEALRLIKEHRIRHLPVHKGGKLVGVMSDTDLRLTVASKGGSELKARDVMTDPFEVRPDAFLDDIVVIMSEQKYRCAIVEEADGKVVGIFTDSDALRTLGDFLRTHYKKT